MEENLRIMSFGGGVQSMAVMVLAAQGAVQYDAFVFANVGEDSENPDTLDYIRDYTLPYAQTHQLEFVEVRRVRRVKSVGSLETTLMKELERANRTVIIPVHLAPSGALGNRNCTTDFKIRVIDKFIRSKSEINSDSKVTVGLGISTDEFSRARDTNWHDRESDAPKSRKLGFLKRREYPLINLRLSRSDAMRIILDAGLPVPPKSSCFFCPFHSKDTWITLKRERPDLFAKAVEVEKLCNSKQTSMGRDRMFLHPSLKPLDQAVADWKPLFGGGDEPIEEGEEGCADGGYCMV